MQFDCDFKCVNFKCNRCIKEGYNNMKRCEALKKNGTCSYMTQALETCSMCNNFSCLKRKNLEIKEKELPFEIEPETATAEEKENEAFKKTSYIAPIDNKVTEIKRPVEAKEDEKESLKKGLEHDFNALATAYVDGSFNSRTSTYGYGVVLMYKDNQHTYNGAGQNEDTAKIRNVAGELIGAMTAVKKAKDMGAKEIIICYDYEGIEKWVTGAWQTKNIYTMKYKEYMNNAGLKIRFKKIKAHSGQCFNEMADKLAKQAVGV